MFKIDKSSVVYIDLNKNSLVGRQMGASEDPSESAGSLAERERYADPALTQQRAMLEEDARQAAEETIASAKYEAGVILSKATLKYEEIKNAAWQSGYNEGLEQARKQAFKEAEEQERELREKLEKRVSALADQYERQMETYARNISQLAVAIAKKIINIQIDKDDAVFVGLVKRAIEHFNASEKFLMKLNEKEYDRFFSQGGDWLTEQMQCAPFSVVRDASLASGGCALESEGGILQAGVDVQLNKVSRILGVDPKQSEDEEL
ncbi:MAG: FliH/SctL family protein [Bacillota bacterium]